MKWMIAFDLDGTLAESKRPLSEDMAATLARLLAVTDVAVISGGDWPQFEKQVASRLPAGAALVGRWIGIERLKRFASRHGRWLTFPLPRGRGETGRHTLRAGPRDRQRLRGRGASRGRARRGGGAAVWTLKRATFARPMNQITITGEES